MNEHAFRYLVLLALVVMRCDLHTVTEKVERMEGTSRRVESAVRHFNDHVVCLTAPDHDDTGNY